MCVHTYNVMSRNQYDSLNANPFLYIQPHIFINGTKGYRYEAILNAAGRNSNILLFLYTERAIHHGSMRTKTYSHLSVYLSAIANYFFGSFSLSPLMFSP